MRDLSVKMNVFEAAPSNELLENREPEEAYCMSVPGREYAVYFPYGGSIDLDISALQGDASLVWCDVLNAKWSVSKGIKSSKSLKLDCPGTGHWIAVIKI